MSTRPAERSGNNARSGGRRLLSGILTTFCTLLLMAFLYCAAVLLQGPAEQREGSFVVQDEPQAVTRMQAASTGDPDALAALFGAPLPVLRGASVEGEGSNALLDGQTARVAALRFPGFTVTAVRPAAAAPLLLRKGLSVSLKTDVTVLNMPAILAARGTEYCVYMTGEDAAYAVYAPGLDEASFLALLDRLTWAMPGTA